MLKQPLLLQLGLRLSRRKRSMPSGTLRGVPRRDSLHLRGFERDIFGMRMKPDFHIE
jgi:hypothetical protein